MFILRSFCVISKFQGNIRRCYSYLIKRCESKTKLYCHNEGKSFKRTQQYSVGTADCIQNNHPQPNCVLSESEIKEIVDGDSELEKTLRVIILEVDILRQDGHLVPDDISKDDWQEMLGLKSRSSRMRYLSYLFKTEKRRENRRTKAEAKQREREENFKLEVENNHIKYGFGGCTIYLRIYDTTIDSYCNKNLMNAAMFSQHIVLDCSYEKYMSRFEQKNCAKQICMLFSENRSHAQPFHLQLCNADPESYTMQSLHRHIPTMYEPHYPMFTTPKSYLDLYPKEKLVYLTPHCRNDLTEWNHDDVYIIGAMVDKSNPKPLSLAKAKEEGLRMAKLPLERYLVWGQGSSKNLTLNQMTSILLDVRHTGDWLQAFKHIPRRKIVGDEELAGENRDDVIKKRTMYKPKYGAKDVLLSSNIIKKVKKQTRIDFSKLYD